MTALRSLPFFSEIQRNTEDWSIFLGYKHAILFVKYGQKYLWIVLFMTGGCDKEYKFVEVNPISYGLLDSVAPTGGPNRSPWDIKEGVISENMLLYSICLLVYLGVIYKNSDRNFKIWVRFQDFKILGIWDFASHCKRKIAISRLILKI